MFKFIKEFMEFMKLKREREIRCKKYVITQTMIKFYEDLQRTKGGLDLPPCICAINAMKELKTDKDVRRIYKKLSVAGLV